MLLQFWKNPEFIRHCRSELRRTRAAAMGAVVMMVCALTILACWASEKARAAYKTESVVVFESNGQKTQLDSSDPRHPKLTDPQKMQPTRGVQRDPVAVAASRSAFRGLLTMQFIALTLWSLLSCAQAVARERERGTWDFQRTTRLTAAELLVGKLLGEPVLGHFIVLCSLPVTIVLGIVGQIGAGNILSAYVLLAASGLFAGLIGLWLSGLFESRSRGIGLIAGLAAFGLVLAMQGFAESPFPGLAGFSPVTTLMPLFGGPRAWAEATIFGGRVSWLAMSLLLYVTFGAWLVVMLLRNLKREFREVRLLSRWQAVGCCAFLNFVLYALLRPQADATLNSYFVQFMTGTNGFILFLLGLSLMNTPERIEAADGTSLSAIFSDQGLPWPWLAVSAAVSYLLFIWGSLAWQKALNLSGQWKTFGLAMLIMLVFVTRDVLFIQWCTLTRMRAPLIKGLLYLCLYYSATAVLYAVISVSSEKAAIAATNVLTPTAAFQTNGLPMSAAFGIVAQVMAIGFLLSAIRGRVQRTALVPAAA